MSKKSDVNERGSDNKILELEIAIIVILAIAVIAVAVYVIVVRVSQVADGENQYDAITEESVSETYEFVVPENEIVENNESEIIEEEPVDPRKDWMEDADGSQAYKMMVDADKLLEANDDYICWIYGCGGDIDYPVCQSDDNQFYLNHGFDKKKNVYGSLFTELLNNGILYTDAVIYGHHMKNGTMFHKLDEYKNKKYFEEHPYFYLFTNRGDAQYEVFSVYNIDMDVLAEMQSEGDDLTREEYIADMKERSIYDTGVDVTGTDKILTLVTCEYTTDNGRMIVHCRKK